MSQSTGEIIDQALQLANRVDPQHRNRARRAVDRALLFYSDKLPWPSLEREETFTSNGTRFMTFPRRVRTIISIGDKTRQYHVEPGGHFGRQFPAQHYGESGQGMWQWSDLGLVPTIINPATDTTLKLSSSQSEALLVTVHGFLRDSTSSGTALELYEDKEVITLGGSEETTTKTFVRIKSIEKDGLDTESYVTIKATTPDDQPIARIGKDERSPQYRRVQFLGTPNAGDQAVVKYFERPTRVVSEDVNLDPAIHPDIIVWRVVGDLHWMGEDPAAAQIAWAQAEKLMDEHMRAQTAQGSSCEQAIPWAPAVERGEEDICE